MAVDDIVLKTVGPELSSNPEKDEKDYKRAMQELPKGNELVIEPLEKALKKATGYSDVNIPSEIIETKFPEDLGWQANFIVKSEPRTTKRPSYKTAVEEMERHLSGIAFLISGGMTISGIAKYDGVLYMGVERLRDEFNIIVAGISNAGVEQTITPVLKEPLASEKNLDKLIIPGGRNIYALTEENFMLYTRTDRLLNSYLKYIGAYKEKLTKGIRKKKATVQTTGKDAYNIEKGKREGPDWPYVVKTLVTVPVRDATIGQLDLLLDKIKTLKQKKQEFPYYDLIEREVRGETLLYISISSVYETIQNLKSGPPVKAKVVSVEHKEIL